MGKERSRRLVYDKFLVSGRTNSCENESLDESCQESCLEISIFHSNSLVLTSMFYRFTA